MKSLKHLMLTTLLLGLLTFSMGQVQSDNWQFTVNDGNMPAYFSTDSDDIRGLAMYDGKVYLGSFRSNGVKILDLATGDSIGTVNESAVALGDVNVDDDGVLFGSKIVSNGQWLPTAPVIIYMWNDAEATRDTLLSFMPDTSSSPWFRLGDKFSVEGSYADGSLEVYLVDSGWWGKKMFKFTMQDGEINPEPEEITFTGDDFVKTDNQAIVAPLPDTDDFFLSGSGRKIFYVNANGELGGAIPSGTVAGDGNALVAFEANDRKFVIQNLIWSAQSFQVLEYTDGVTNASRHWGLTPEAFGPSGNNGNQVGDVDYINNGDGTITFSVLMTDNGIGCYTLEVPVEPVDPVNMSASWQIDGGERDYFPASGDVVRGMGYSPKDSLVLIASRTDDKIHLLDAETGTDAGALDMTGVDGGFYGIKLMKAVADDEGVIYACNLAQGGEFKIYRWADTSAVPTVALQQTVTNRFGDVMAIYGSGTDTKIYASERNGTTIKVFGTTDGENFEEVQTIPIPSGGANGGISVVDEAHLWINAAWNDPVKIDTAGTVISEPSGIDNYYGNVLYMEGKFGQKLLAVSANHSDGNRRKVKVYDITEDEANPSFWANGETGNPEKDNANVAGDLQYSLNVDGNITFYQMTTNNAIAAWELEVPKHDNDLTLTFDDDSDIDNWGNYDETNVWTSFIHDADKKALKIHDAGWDMLGKRPIYATEGTRYRLSLSAMVENWGHETNDLMVTVQGIDETPDTVAITDFDTFQTAELSGIADSSQGYVKFFGAGNGDPTDFYIDFLYFDDFAEDVNLVVDTTQLDFGKTAFHGNKTMMVQAVNTGSEDMVFDSFRFNSGDYFSAGANVETVAPGDTAMITVAFNPENTETISDKVTVVTNGGIANIHMTGYGYELWPMDWRMLAGDDGSDWFWTESLQNYCRGIGYNPVTDHIYVVSQIGGPHIYMLDPETGEFIGELDNTGIAQNGATYHVDKVDVTDNGEIIISSLGRTPDNFNIYYYESETAQPEMIFSEDIGIVGGGDLAVEGTGEDMKIYSAGYWSSNGNNEELNKMVTITKDGEAWTHTITDLPEPKAAGYGISAAGNGYLFINGPSVTPRYIKNDGTVLHEFDPAVVASGTSIEYFEVETVDSVRRFIGITNGWSSGVHMVELLGEPGDNLCSSFETMDAPTEDYQYRTNLNATAQMVYNKRNNSFVELVTNNGITSYSLDVVEPNPVAEYNTPFVSIAPRNIDFGDLMGTVETVSFEVTNTGTMPLAIDSVISNSASLTTTLVSDSLDAGETKSYDLSFDPLNLSGDQTAQLKFFTNNGLDFVNVEANCIVITGDPIDENFGSWEAFDGHGWSGINAEFWDLEGYGRGDNKFIGGNELNQDVTILTPKLVDPNNIVFYYGEYSGGSDSWNLQVMVADDTTGGEINWVDTLGTFSAPGDLNWYLGNFELEDAGDVFIGFQISGEISGTFYLDDIKIDGKGLWIEGTEINQSFASWDSYEGTGWSGANVTLRTDGYGHGDDNYIGPSDDGLNNPSTVITPKLVNPTHVSFYYGIYNIGDSWTGKVLLSRDGGVTWCDTLGTVDAPENFDWAYADYEIEKEGDLYVGIVVDGSVSGGMFIDDFKADADGRAVATDDEKLPLEFNLSQNYPNPFNPTTNIKLVLPKAEKVKMVVYNLTGQKVATIKNETMKAGYHTINFDGSRLSSGVYFYKVKAGSYNAVKKMTILK